jgi:hypothetical protein
MIERGFADDGPAANDHEIVTFPGDVIGHLDHDGRFTNETRLLILLLTDSLLSRLQSLWISSGKDVLPSFLN